MSEAKFGGSKTPAHMPIETPTPPESPNRDTIFNKLSKELLNSSNCVESDDVVKKAREQLVKKDVKLADGSFILLPEKEVINFETIIDRNGDPADTFCVESLEKTIEDTKTELAQLQKS